MELRWACGMQRKWSIKTTRKRGTAQGRSPLDTTVPLPHDNLYMYLFGRETRRVVASLSCIDTGFCFSRFLDVPKLSEFLFMSFFVLSFLCSMVDPHVTEYCLVVSTKRNYSTLCEALEKKFGVYYPPEDNNLYLSKPISKILQRRNGQSLLSNIPVFAPLNIH